MATRDQMISDALKDLKQGLQDMGDKLERKLDNYSRDMVELRDRVTKLETRISIVFGILAAIGLSLIGALVKYIVK